LEEDSDDDSPFSAESSLSESDVLEDGAMAAVAFKEVKADTDGKKRGVKNTLKKQMPKVMIVDPNWKLNDKKALSAEIVTPGMNF